MTPVFSRLDNLGIYPRTADNIDPSHQEGKHQELRQRIEARARDLRGKWETDGDITTEQYRQDEFRDQSKMPVQKESQDRLALIASFSNRQLIHRERKKFSTTVRPRRLSVE